MKYIVLLIISLTSCSYYSFDNLYKKGKFQEAYTKLLSTGKNSDPEFTEREIKVVVNLVVSGQKEYLPVLDSLLLSKPKDDALPLYLFAKSWIRFISAKTEKDFEDILTVLPTEKLNDPYLEPLRMIILAHSLFTLERYDELITIFQSSGIAKKNSDLLYLQGLARLRLGNRDMAYNYFRQTIKVSTNNTLKGLAYFYIAEIYEYKKKDMLALENYFKSWELEPYNAETNYRIGKFLQKNTYNNLHNRFFRAALRINENLAAAWYALNIQ